jgi:Flp pilus assembly pilin Flp
MVFTPLAIAIERRPKGTMESFVRLNLSNGVFRSLLARLLRDEQGAELIEYVLISGLIIAAVIATLASFGTKVMARWTSINSSM